MISSALPYEMMIRHGDMLLFPPLAGDVTVEWERQGAPGKMRFKALLNVADSFEEGDACRFSVNGTPIFFGFIFSRSRTGTCSEAVEVTVYDQLYYLKNKDTYIYQDKTAADVVRMIAEDYQLRLGELSDTRYRIATRTEEDATLFDVIQNALDQTLSATGKMFILYDRIGSLCLSALDDMKLNVVLCADTVGQYEEQISIADQTYNRIKLRAGSQTGPDLVYVAEDRAAIDRWGLLQYTQKIDADGGALKSTAEQLLRLYGSPTRRLKIRNALGDVRVRGGSLLPVLLTIGHETIARYLMVETVGHTFGERTHTMDLNLRGGDYVV